MRCVVGRIAERLDLAMRTATRPVSLIGGLLRDLSVGVVAKTAARAAKAGIAWEVAEDLLSSQPLCFNLFAELQHALGGGLPHRPLHVSPDHSLLVHGCLVQAQALVNGRTIEQAQEWTGDVEYFHIETENHEVILAEGAPAETFIDNVSRERFENHQEFLDLYPDSPPMAELDLPRICFARQLPRAMSSALDAVADGIMGRRSDAA